MELGYFFWLLAAEKPTALFSHTIYISKGYHILFLTLSYVKYYSQLYSKSWNQMIEPLSVSRLAEITEWVWVQRKVYLLSRGLVSLFWSLWLNRYVDCFVFDKGSLSIWAVTVYVMKLPVMQYSGLLFATNLTSLLN